MLPKWSFTFRVRDTDEIPLARFGATPENYRATELRADYKEPRLSTDKIIACPPNSVATQANGERWIRDRYGNWRLVGKNGKPRHNVAARSVLDICHHGLIDLEIP